MYCRPGRAPPCDVHTPGLDNTPQAPAHPATLHPNFNAATMMAMFFVADFEPRYPVFEAFRIVY
jgi:hypothetical protein